MTNFSGTSAFSNSIKTKIIQHSFDHKELSKFPSIGLGKNAEECGSKHLEYRYSLNLK